MDGQPLEPQLRGALNSTTAFGGGALSAANRQTCISGLCEAGTFRFDNPKPWRRNVKVIPV